MPILSAVMLFIVRYVLNDMMDEQILIALKEISNEVENFTVAADRILNGA